MIFFSQLDFITKFVCDQIFCNFLSFFFSTTEISRIFSTNPSSQSGNLGSSVIFECAISSLPTALITWQLNGNNVLKGRTVTMPAGESRTRSTLTLTSLQHEDRGQYRCLAENPLLGPPVVYSEPASLTLIGKSQLCVMNQADDTCI